MLTNLNNRHFMRLVHAILIISSLLFFSNCTSDKISIPDSTTFSLGKVKKVSLAGGTLLELMPVVHPIYFGIIDSLLIIRGDCAENSNLMHIYSINTCRKIISFASKGRGPNEFNEIFEFQIIPETNELYIPDLIGQTSRVYSIDSLVLSKKTTPVRVISFNGTPYNGIRMLDSESFLCNYGRYQIPGNSMYTKLVIPSLDVMSTIGYPPLDSNVMKLPVIGYRNVFANRCSFNPTSGKIVIAYSNTDLLEVYDDDLMRLSRIQGPDFFLPVWENTGMGVNTYIPGKSKSAYSSPVALDDGFFVTYSGNEVTPVEVSKPQSERRIFFFNYSGELISEYILDVSGIDIICIDNLRNYMIVRQGRTYLYLYKLKGHV